MPIADELKRYERHGRDKEKVFTNSFVIPLLQRLGMSVVYNHGTREYGRDVILGTLDMFGHFLFYGVQVKFEGSIGLGDGSRSIANDARQAFLNPFQHPQTGRMEWITRFYIVNAGSISEQAIEDIFRQVENQAIASNTVLIDGVGIIALDKVAAYTRGTMVREGITGLLLEIRCNRACMEIMRNNLTPPITVNRCCLYATAAYLERPFLMQSIPYSVVQHYWQAVRAINAVLDDLTSHVRVGQKDQENRTVAFNGLSEEVSPLADELEAALVSVLAGLGVTVATQVFPPCDQSLS